MNTQKQITIMVTLVFALLAGCAAYTVYDQPRENSAIDAQAATLAERGARIFARYCRQCHGDMGQGRIGPALNRPELQDPNTRQATQQWVMDTIMCGRIGKIMPPWAITEGGALDNEQIQDLVALITTNAGNAAGTGWQKAGQFSAIENKTAPEASVPEVLAGAVITGSTGTKVCGQVAATPAPAEASGPPAGVAAKDQWDETTTDNKFSTTDMVVSVGQPVTVNVDNAGQAMHNWDVLDASGAPSLKDASGKAIITNPQLLAPGTKATVTFTISTPGTYNFRCDVHPTEMTGKLFVVAGGGAAASPTPAP
jgi:mono/diheme cytochrome c family protein/plastocyanin